MGYHHQVLPSEIQGLTLEHRVAGWRDAGRRTIRAGSSIPGQEAADLKARFRATS
jgi:hypothetical protein